ncbi:MAG: cardiolipin synthase [Epulopiscium sp. Nuni2H_MBin003]|nr:MAG: cardiolipin synthase [Epulopiscium sp. Nuni2H_MBin003]
MRLFDKVKTKKTIQNRLLLTGVISLIQLLIFFYCFVKFIELSVFVSMILYLLSMVFIVYLIGGKEPSAYKITWIIVLHLLPLMGILIYLLWGRKAPAKKLTASVAKSSEKIIQCLNADEHMNCHFLVQGKRAYSTARYLKEVTHYPAFCHSDVKYYSIGEDYFEDMLKVLNTAEKFIFMEYYIIEEGLMWDQILAILVEKAKQGVQVRVMYDDMGCMTTLHWQYREYLEKVHENIKCIAFNRVKLVVALVMNNRDHRKILVVDGKVGFTGGINLADEYINKKVKYGHWKDTGIRITGNAVWGLTCLFIEMWNVSAEEILDPNDYKTNIEHNTGIGFVQPFGDSPLDDVTVGQNVYVDIINQANESIYIMTPYLILDDYTRSAIILAARRGIDVNILTPGIPDKKAVFRITRANYVPLLEVGVKIYEYTKGFLHAKSIVVDKKIAMIGTINLDYRSMYLNFECGVFMYGVSAIKDLEVDAINTIKLSNKIEQSDLKMGIVGKVRNAILMIFAPLM